jgi:hypothetical protein
MYFQNLHVHFSIIFHQTISVSSRHITSNFLSRYFDQHSSTTYILNPSFLGHYIHKRLQKSRKTDQHTYTKNQTIIFTTIHLHIKPIHFTKIQPISTTFIFLYIHTPPILLNFIYFAFIFTMQFFYFFNF